MKAPILSPVTFDPVARTVTLTGLTVDLQRLYVIANLTRGVIYYAAGRVGAGTTVSSPVITLPDAGLMGGHLASDELFVLYEQDDPQLTTVISRLSDLIVELGAKLEPSDLAGLATQATLQNLLTELQQKLEPTDLAALATEATLASVATDLAATTHAEDSPHATGHVGQLLLAVRRDADASDVDATGDYTPIHTDEEGRLKASVKLATYAPVTGNITASGQSVAIRCDRMGQVVITMVATSLTGHNSTFEFSNNSTNGTDGTWYPFRVIRSNANTAESTTGVLAATPAYGWEASVNGYNWIRVRATAHTGGTAAYILQGSAGASENAPFIDTHGVTLSSLPALATGANLAGDVALQYRASAGGGASAAAITSPGTTAPQSIKGSGGRLIGYSIKNNAAAPRFVKFFNATTVTMGTTAAVFEERLEPGERLVVQYAVGLAFGTGLQIACTAARGLTDNTSTGLAAADLTGHIDFV